MSDTPSVSQMIRSMDYVDLIPHTLSLSGRPLDVKNRRPMFSPLFRRSPLARRQIFLCGRQIGKTVSACAAIMMNCIWRQQFKVLYVSPLAMITNRLHHVYMAPMMRNLRVPFKVQDRSCVSNVHEKTFLNGSHFHGVSCFNSAGNALGLPIDMMIIDETQDLNFEFIPQIRETLGASAFRYEMFFGTARGVDNTIEKVFDGTTRSEYAIRCRACNEWNIPSLDQQAISMIQRHGIACGHRNKKGACGRILNIEEDGQWVHAHPDRQSDFIGWHVPQTIVYERVYGPKGSHPDESIGYYLDTIYNKLYGTNPYSKAQYLQEVLGISTEQGNIPLTREDIRNVRVLDVPQGGISNPNAYSNFGGGADWGGSEILSFTVGVVTGRHIDGSIHCVGAIKPTGVPDDERHLPLAAFFRRCVPYGAITFLAGDYGFVGSVQNKHLERASGIPTMSIQYGTAKKFYIPHPGNVFLVDRTTLLYVVYNLIKGRKLLLPKNDWFDPFVEDLLANYIEETDTPSGAVLRYKKYADKPDDFLHSLAYSIFACILPEGIDLPGMVGLSANSSITKSMIADIGEEGIPGLR